MKAWIADHGFWASDRSLATYRILFSLGMLFMVTPGSTLVLGDVPDSLYHPPLGPMMLLGGWPDRGVLVALELVVQLALVFVLFGLFTRSASFTLAFTGALLAGFRYSTGKIDHEFVLVVGVPLLMAFTSWGHRWSLDALRPSIRNRGDFRRQADWQLQALALTVGASYFTSGFAKAVTGWLDTEGSATKGWLVTYLYQHDWSANFINTALVDINSGIFWKANDVAAVAMEMGVLIAALRRKWFVRYLIVLVVFHLSVYTMFGINFSRLLLVYLAFLHLDRFASWLRLDSLRRIRPAWAYTAFAATAAFVAWGYLSDEEPFRVLRTISRLMPIENAVWISALVLIVVGVRELVLIVRRRRAGEPMQFPPSVDTTAPETPANPRRSLQVLVAVLLVLVTQLTLLFTLSEPHPAPTGPLFMGNRSQVGGVISYKQFMAIETGGTSFPTRASNVLPTKPAFVTYMRQIRFPNAPVDRQGEVTTPDAPLWERIPLLGHRYSSDHLPGYDGELDDETRRWIREGIAKDGIECQDDCTLVVVWVSQRINPRTQKLVPDSRQEISRETWDLSLPEDADQS